MPRKKKPSSTIITELSAIERNAANRLARLERFVLGRLNPSESMAIRKIDGQILLPALPTSNRSELKPAWRTTDRFLTEKDMQDASRVNDPDAAKSKFAKRDSYVGTYYGYNGIMRPEYDLLEAFTLFDTEPIVRQAITRRMSLMFRNGFEVTSEQPRLANYISNRLDTMEYVMGKSKERFFQEILYNLVLISNCFLLKIRDKDASGGVATDRNKNKVPVAGYQIIPSHTIFPWLEKGIIKKWRRLYDTGQPYEDYSLDDIIHLKWDVKPGHIFGTPRTVGVRDDIFALRRLEENIELLFINHLFPLFHIKVGNEAAPCTYYEDGTSEVDLIRQQIETMPKEGVFVTDDRVTVDSVGAEGKSLETKELIAHLKGRVYTGLGMSPLDMGEGDTANRSTTNNISQVLKDAIKCDLDNFGGMIRMTVFKEFFQETSMSLSVQGAVAETRLEFHEIDMDNKIKEENHANQLYNSSLLTHGETRKRMKMKPLEKKDHKDTHYEQHDKDLVTHQLNLQHENAKEMLHEEAGVQKELLTHQTKEAEKQANTTMALHKSEVEKEHGKAKAAHIKANAQVKVLKAKTAHAAVAGIKKPSNTKKQAQNRNTPTNQHGRKTAPTKAKSSQEILEMIYDRLAVNYELWDKESLPEWEHLANSAVEGVLREYEEADLSTDSENSYTKQVRMGADRLKAMVASTPDLEQLYALVLGFEDINAGTDTEYDDADYSDEDSDHDSVGTGVDEPGDSGTVLQDERDPAGTGDPEPRSEE